MKVESALPSSRQRILDHGEVFTPPGLVNDMLDLVANECEREDSRFLEPACGDGNFLTEVLRRRLAHVSRKHRAQRQWEAHALLGLACLYGIELLPDNAERCRDRMVAVFRGAYEARFESSAKAAVVRAARHIVARNVLQGDALSMTGPTGAPLVLTEWALVGRGMLKRRLFEYRELAPEPRRPAPNLFEEEPSLFDEDGKPVFLARHLRHLPPVHYLDLAEEEEAP